MRSYAFLYKLPMSRLLWGGTILGSLLLKPCIAPNTQSGKKQACVNPAKRAAFDAHENT